MEPSRDNENKREERLSFFEKMAMIEPKLEVQKKQKLRTYGETSDPQKENNIYDLADKVKQKFLLERLSSLSPSSSPRSHSQSPSPTRKNSSERVSESSSCDITTEQTSGKELKDTTRTSSSNLKKSTNNTKERNKSGKITVQSDEHSTSAQEMNTAPTSTSNGSQAHINAAQIELSSSQRSDTASATTDNSSEEDFELRKTPVVCLEIMQKEMIEKHLSSSCSSSASSTQSGDKKQDLPTSRTKLKEVAKSSPRSSPKLVKKPFRRSSVKSVSDSQVECVSAPKAVKTPTKTSAVSPIKNETTPPKSQSKSNNKRDECGALKQETRSGSVRTLLDDASSTHSSVDQEVVQIIPRFGADGDIDKNVAVLGKRGASNTNYKSKSVSEDTKSVDSIELCSSISQLSCSIASIDTNSASLCDIVEQRSGDAPGSISIPRSSSLEELKSGVNISIGSKTSVEVKTRVQATVMETLSLSSPKKRGISSADPKKLRKKKKDSRVEKKITDSLSGPECAKAQKKDKTTKVISSKGKSTQAQKKEKSKGRCPTSGPLVPVKNTKRTSAMKAKDKDLGADTQGKQSVIEVEKSQGPSKKMKSPGKKIIEGSVAQKASPPVRKRSKSPKGRCESLDSARNNKTEVNDTERLLGTTTRSGRKVKISAAALEALEAAVAEDDADDVSPELTAAQLGQIHTGLKNTKNTQPKEQKRKVPAPLSSKTSPKSSKSSAAKVSPTHKTLQAMNSALNLTSPKGKTTSTISKAMPSISRSLQSAPQIDKTGLHSRTPSVSPARKTKSDNAFVVKQIEVHLLEETPRLKSATPSPARSRRSATSVKESGSLEKVQKSAASSKSPDPKTRSPTPSPARSTRSSSGIKSPINNEKMEITTPSPSKSTTPCSTKNVTPSPSKIAPSSDGKSGVRSTKLSPTARKSCRQTLFVKENISVITTGKDVVKNVQNMGSMGDTLIELLQRPLPLKRNAEQTSPAGRKEKGKSPSKGESNTKSTDAKVTRLTRGRKKGLDSLIIQIEDSLKVGAPVPQNLQIFTGGSSSEESGSSDEQSDDGGEEQNLQLSEVEDRSPLKQSPSESFAHSSMLQVTLPVGKGKSPKKEDVQCQSKSPAKINEKKISGASPENKRRLQESVESKKIRVSPPKVRRPFKTEPVVVKTEFIPDKEPKLSVFESGDSDPTSAFSSDILDNYLVNHRDIYQSLKDDPIVFKPLSPPSKYIASHAPHTSPKKQISIKPDVDDIDGIKCFSYSSSKELDIHVKREKAIIEDWNYEPESEKIPSLQETEDISFNKTDDFTQIKGWRSRVVPASRRKITVPKLNLYAARGLIQKLGSNVITDLGLRLKARRRRSPVLLHKQFDEPREPEKKTSINIYGRKPDGRFATKRSTKKGKVGRTKKNEAGWREGWWNPVRGNKVRPEVLSAGVALIAASALSLDFEEEDELDEIQCGEPGCRYGCVCHLCETLPDIQVTPSGPLPELDVNSLAESDCVKEYCRLGCICDSISPLRGGQKPIWKKKKNQHCGRPDCMFGCECGPKTRGMLQRQSPATLPKPGPIRLLNSSTFSDYQEDDLDARMMSRWRKTSTPDTESIPVNKSIENKILENSVKKESNCEDGQTEPIVKQRGRKRKLKNTKKENEDRPKRKYVSKCTAEERQREMEEKLATARKSSRLTGHQSLAKIEKLNSLIYYDTAAWLNKENKKGKGNKGSEDDPDKLISPEDIKNEVIELEPDSVQPIDGKIQKTKEKTVRSATPGSSNGNEKKKKLSEAKTDEGSNLVEIRQRKMHPGSPRNAAECKKHVSDTESSFTSKSCARATIYTHFRRKTSCKCQDDKCVHRLTEAIAQRKSKDLELDEARRRCSLDGKHAPNNSTSGIGKTGQTMRRNSVGGVFMSNIQNIPQFVGAPALPTYSRFRTQMVVLQRTVPTDTLLSPGTPENKRPHLLEICSNCTWEPIRSQLLGRMSAICSVMGDFPPEMSLEIEQYSVVVLPKPDKTTPIPLNLQPVLQTQEMFAIRLKITAIGSVDANQPPNVSELNIDSLSDNNVRELEQISKAPTLAGMLAMPTPLYATPQTDQVLGISAFKTISLSISDGKIVSTGPSIQQIPREFAADADSSFATINRVLPSSTAGLSPVEPLEIIPISDDSSPDCSPGSSKHAVINQANATTINDQCGSVDSDSQGEETVTVTIDEDMLEDGTSQEGGTKTDDDCTSQEGDRVTVTIDEEMLDSSNEPGKKSEDKLPLSGNIAEKLVSPTFASTDDSEDDILSCTTGHNFASGESSQGSAVDKHAVDKKESDAVSAVVIETTDDDGSQDSISIGLPDLRPSSSCSNRSEHSINDQQQSETETTDQALLPELLSDSSVAHKTKSTPGTSNGQDASNVLTGHSRSETEKSDQAGKNSCYRNSSGQEASTNSETPPVRLESGSVKLLSVNGVLKQDTTSVGNTPGGNGGNVNPPTSGTIRPVALKDQKPILSIPGLTLIPVTTIHETVINGNSTKAYKQEKIAVPMSVICSQLGLGKPSKVKSGARRYSAGAATSTKSESITSMRSPSADLPSKLAMTLSHFTPVSASKGAKSPKQTGSSKGDLVISSLKAPDGKVSGIDGTRAFIPLDQLGVLGGLNKLQGCIGSAFRPVSAASPAGSGKESTKTKTPTSTIDDDFDSGRTSTLTSSCDWDDDGSDSDISVGVEDTCFSGMSISIDDIEEDAVETETLESSVKQMKRKRKQGLLERPTSLDSVEFAREFSASAELIEEENRRGKEHKLREKQRRSDIKSGFRNLYTVVQEIENLPVENKDSRYVTKILILKKALKAIDKLVKEEKRLKEEEIKLSQERNCMKKVLGLSHQESEIYFETEICSSDKQNEDVDDILQDMEGTSTFQMYASTPENNPTTVKAKTVFPPVRVVKKQDAAERKRPSSEQIGQRSVKKRPISGAKVTAIKGESPSQTDVSSKELADDTNTGMMYDKDEKITKGTGNIFEDVVRYPSPE